MKPYEITPALSPLLSPLPTSPSHTPTPALTLRSCDWSNIGPISFGNGGVNKRVTHSPWICQLLLLAQTERRGEEKRPLNFPSLENLIPGYGVGAASAHSHKTLSWVVPALASLLGVNPFCFLDRSFHIYKVIVKEPVSSSLQSSKNMWLDPVSAALAVQGQAWGDWAEVDSVDTTEKSLP